MKKFIITVFSGLFILHLVARHVGYCFDEGRILSEEEIIIIALRQSHRSISVTQQKPAPDVEGTKAYIDERVTEFLRKNPDCCKIMTGSDRFENGEGHFGHTFVGWLSGAQTYVVEIKYRGKRQNSSLYSRVDDRVIYRTVGSCGVVFRFY